MDYQLDYFYGKEADQFNFLRIPKLLFKDKRFKGLSSDSKLLYALLLDRMSLSSKNGWFDNENRVYIYFTVNEAMEELNIAREKCTKIFAELDSEKGCGLIIKVRQGLGKPDVIYVMNFLSSVSDNNNEYDCEEVKNAGAECENIRSSKIETPEIRKSNFKKFGNQTSAVSENEFQEVRKSKSNDNEFNKNINNNTDTSDIYPITSYQRRETLNNKDVMDEVRKRGEYRQLISENIEYGILVKNYSQSSADDVLETMLDAVCSTKDYLWLGDEKIPQVVVKSRLLKLNYGHIEYALDSIKRNCTNVCNPKKYLLVTLYNSITSIDTFYTTAVNYELYGNE